MKILIGIVIGSLVGFFAPSVTSLFWGGFGGFLLGLAFYHLLIKQEKHA